MNGQYLTTDAKNRSRNHNVPDQGHPPPSYREIIRSTRLTLPDFFETTSSTQRTADRWLIKYRWPDGPRCPHCGSPDVEEERPQTAEAETRFRCGSLRSFHGAHPPFHRLSAGIVSTLAAGHVPHGVRAPVQVGGADRPLPRPGPPDHHLGHSRHPSADDGTVPSAVGKRGEGV